MFHILQGSTPPKLGNAEEAEVVADAEDDGETVMGIDEMNVVPLSVIVILAKLVEVGDVEEAADVEALDVDAALELPLDADPLAEELVDELLDWAAAKGSAAATKTVGRTESMFDRSRLSGMEQKSLGKPMSAFGTRRGCPTQ